MAADIQGEKEMDRKCALCNLPFKEKGDSAEHVIPNSIGGRQTVRGFLCRDCNAMTGARWDNELARQLNPVCNLLNISRERGSPPNLVVDTVGGKRLRHRSDGHMTTHLFEVLERQEDGKVILNMRAPTMRELKKNLPGLVRKYPQLAGVDLLKHAKRTKEYLNDPMAIELTFGGLDAGRSIVKSCVALAYVAGVRLSDLDCAKKFLCGQGDPCFGYYNETDFVLNRPPKTFFHCVHVRGDGRSGKALGYVEYFGYQRVVVVLSDSYCGRTFSECYAIDPVAGEEIALNVKVPYFSDEEIREIYDCEKLDYATCRNAIGDLVASYMEQATAQARRNAVEDAVEYAFDNCGAEPGGIITEEQAKRLAALVTHRLIPFVEHQLGLPSLPPRR